MIKNLYDRLSESVRKLAGRDKLTEDNIQESLLEVREALLDADVPPAVVSGLLERIKNKVIGQKVVSGLRARDLFVKSVYDELVEILGGESKAEGELNLKAQPPVVILMAGLQGAGKTTTVAKLAVWLAKQHKKRVMAVSCDIYRPAAIEQLRVLADQYNFAFHASSEAVSADPVAIAKEAHAEAKRHLYDVLIVDTAGRLHVQQELMEELKEIKAAVGPTETLLVIDGMIGRDSFEMAKRFSAEIQPTGAIITKTDSDTRVGVSLGVRYVANCPIKFLGIGEKIADGLERFYPDRIASRILGMGDVLSLVEQVYSKIDQQKTVDVTRKVLGGGRMDLEDMRGYLQQISKLGGAGGIMDKLPMFAGKINEAMAGDCDGKIKQMMVVIDSMTMKERRFPANIRASQKQRIAKGSGTSIAIVNDTLRYHQKIQRQMAQFRGGKLAKLVSKMPSFDTFASLLKGGK